MRFSWDFCGTKGDLSKRNKDSTKKTMEIQLETLEVFKGAILD
jgi:hypothetical protein